MSLTKVTYSMINGAVVNALDFGADNTGSDDSTAAIQAAIDSFGAATSYAVNTGGTVFLPKGIYKITNLTLKNGITLLGEGKQLTILKAIGSSGYAIASAELSGSTRSYQTNVKGLQVNGDPNLKVISGGTANATCGGIYLPSSIGLIVEDVAVFYMNTGLTLATTQDSQFINVEALFSDTANLIITYYGSDTSNALRFTDCRFASSTTNVVIDGTSASQVRDVTFNGCTFEAGVLDISRCDGIRFTQCSFTSQTAGVAMVQVKDNSGIDTRDICFTNNLFNSGLSYTALAMTATQTVNPVVVANNTITTLAPQAFSGNITFVNNTLMDTYAPYAYLLPNMICEGNAVHALQTPTPAALEANGVVTQVAYSASVAKLQVWDDSAGTYINGDSIVHNQWYKNQYGYDIIVSAHLKIINTSVGSANCAIYYKSTRAGLVRSSPVFAAIANASTNGTTMVYTFRVPAGQYFEILLTDATSVNCVGAMLT